MIERTKDINKAIKFLLDQKPVVIFQGESELGPRALGNRSILFDPRNKNAQEIINNIKGREWWRPLAGTILLEHTKKYFELGRLKESPYMCYAIPAKQKAIDEIPSIVHVDNTCRIQTLTKKQNKNYYDLINCFYKHTKIPVLLNTSFNIAGYPIVEDIDFAIWSCEQMKIDLIYAP